MGEFHLPRDRKLTLVSTMVWHIFHEGSSHAEYCPQKQFRVHVMFEWSPEMPQSETCANMYTSPNCIAAFGTRPFVLKSTPSTLHSSLCICQKDVLIGLSPGCPSRLCPGWKEPCASPVVNRFLSFTAKHLLCLVSFKSAGVRVVILPLWRLSVDLAKLAILQNCV